MDANLWAQVGRAVFQVRVTDLAHRDADGKVVGLRGEFVNPTSAVSRLSAFIPLSELECLEKPDEPEKFLGKVLRCRVINMGRGSSLVLSEKQVCAVGAVVEAKVLQVREKEVVLCCGRCTPAFALKPAHALAVGNKVQVRVLSRTEFDGIGDVLATSFDLA